MSENEIDIPSFAKILTPIHPACAPQYTPDKDIQSLCWLAQRTSGNVVELGCHMGFTTANLAWHNPKKTVYGIDWIGGVDTMHPSQIKERPKMVNNIGVAASKYYNAICCNMISSSIEYKTLNSVTMVFVDADHTYLGCKRDTEIALNHLENMPNDKTRFLVWHDYATEYMVGHPEWLQVGKYVRDEIAPKYPINFIRETTVAWIEWVAKPKCAIGVVTYNRLDIVKKCLPTWVSQGFPVIVYDNGSTQDMKKWLSLQNVYCIHSETNNGISKGRNAIINECRGKYDYVLLMDSDIELAPECAYRMLETAETSPSAAFVVTPFAIRNHMVDQYGRLAEASGECMLTRLSAIDEIGLFPEALSYYSSDSWLMTIATMQGWWTVVCPTADYIHHKHSSRSNAGVSESALSDVALWAYRESAIEKYCENRSRHGKYGQIPLI